MKQILSSEGFAGMILPIFISASYGPATLPEASWTLVAVLGSILSLILIRARLRTMSALYENQLQISALDFEIQETLAKSHVADEAKRLAKHGIAGIIGVVALSTYPVNPNVPVTQLGVIMATGLIFISILTAWSSYDGWKTHTKLLAKARNAEAELRRAHYS
jgi:hypothetical protein